MASRSFRVPLGASKNTDVTEGTSAPSGDFVEVRVDEAISTDLDKIILAIRQLEVYIVELKRYA